MDNRFRLAAGDGLPFPLPPPPQPARRARRARDPQRLRIRIIIRNGRLFRVFSGRYYHTFCISRTVTRWLVDIGKVFLSIFFATILHAVFEYGLEAAFSNTPWLNQVLSEVHLFYNLGPFMIFISPLSLCPFKLPDWVPFQQSYVAIMLCDVPLPLPVLSQMIPCVVLYIPPMSSLSLSSLPPFTVCLSLKFDSIENPLTSLIPTVQVCCPLSSLVTLRFSDITIRLTSFIIKPQKPTPSTAPFDLNMKQLESEYLNALETNQISDDMLGACVPLL